MPRILLSNDDGIDSPMLVPLARALRELGEVHVVVPASERSWIGKAITRFEPVTVDRRRIDGIDMVAVAGSPADCVSVAVHSLLDDAPDLVVSGINLGLNFGTSFFVSSGTIGAALEGWICGLPAIALSMAIPNDAYGLKGAERNEALGDRPAAAAGVSRDLVDVLWRTGFTGEVDLYSVNLPDTVSAATPRVVAPVTRTRYGKLFVPGPTDGSYQHRFSSLQKLEDRADGDVAAVLRGEIAVSPIRLDVSAAAPRELHDALHRPRPRDGQGE